MLKVLVRRNDIDDQEEDEFDGEILFNPTSQVLNIN